MLATRRMLRRMNNCESANIRRQTLIDKRGFVSAQRARHSGHRGTRAAFGTQQSAKTGEFKFEFEFRQNIRTICARIALAMNQISRTF